MRDVNSVIAFARDGKTQVKVFHTDRAISYEEGFPSYCFVRDDDLWKVALSWGNWEKNGHNYRLTEFEKSVGVNVRGRPVTKLSFTAPMCVKMLRNRCLSNGIPVYEADIPYRRRWLWETRPEMGAYKPLYWDIEVDSRTGFQDPNRLNGEEMGRILSIGAVGYDGEEICVMEKDEEALIKDFFEWARGKYGVLVGWNTEYFDVPYVEKRARALGMWSPFHGLETFDLLKIYKRIKSPESGKLNVVANLEIGEGKTDEFESRQQARDLWDSFEGDQEMLQRYNIQDCRLVKGIDEKYRFVESHEEVSRSTFIPLSDTVYAGRIVDAAVVQAAMQKEPRLVMPTKTGRDIEEDVAGGHVMEAARGFYQNVALLDFQSMYPSIIRGFNVSSETPNPKGMAKSQVLAFDLWPAGVFTNALQGLLDIRLRERALKASTSGPEQILHKSRDDVLKQTVNAFYGVISSPYSRFYDTDVANSITQTGQFLIQQLGLFFLDQRIGKPLYGDTDSLFIQLPRPAKPGDIEEVATDFVKDLVQTMGGDPSPFQVESQYIFEKFVLTDRKKKYYGVTRYVGHKKERKEIVKGFELRKKNVMSIQKEALRTLFRIIYEQPDKESAFDLALTYLQNLKKELVAGKHDDKLVMKLHVMKQRHEYKADPMHVRAADLLPADLQLSPGDVVRYTVIDVDKAGRPVAVPVLNGTPQFQKKGYDYIFKHYILQMARRIFPGIDPENTQVRLHVFGSW